MKTISTLLLVLLATLIMQAQSFETQTKAIAERIDSITQAERLALKKAVEKIDAQLEKGEINHQKANEEKNRIADYHAERIENQVNAEKEKLDLLIANRVENQIYSTENDTVDGDSIVIKIKKNKNVSEKRTTSQLVFGIGLNMLQGDEGGLGDHMKGWQSKFVELGVTWNTRLSRESNLFHVKYGPSLVWNSLSPEDNLIFTPLEDQTVLLPSDIDFKRNRFRNLYANFALHFELDFSPMKRNDSGEKIFRSHEGFRLGFGGFTGVLMNSKNKFKYHEGVRKVVAEIKDNYNVNNFNYGLSGYLGYKQFSLYAKYDLQPMFENNPVDENLLSLGVRWDFN
ncbi:MAG: hypothetical protein Q4G27_04285 [Flavobacteriaceae bacterium]|nr:hypothetical protein [Flavobacteriaceae bacterium]